MGWVLQALLSLALTAEEKAGRWGCEPKTDTLPGTAAKKACWCGCPAWAAKGLRFWEARLLGVWLVVGAERWCCVCAGGRRAQSRQGERGLAPVVGAAAAAVGMAAVGAIPTPAAAAQDGRKQEEACQPAAPDGKPASRWAECRDNEQQQQQRRRRRGGGAEPPCVWRAPHLSSYPDAP